MTALLLDKTVSGRRFASRVRTAFGTWDPEAIAAMCALTVVNGSWEPVTAGEFDFSSGVITVNTRADADRMFVIAHELGHFFLGVVQRSEEQERFCDEFADALLKSE